MIKMILINSKNKITNYLKRFLSNKFKIMKRAKKEMIL